MRHARQVLKAAQACHLKRARMAAQLVRQQESRHIRRQLWRRIGGGRRCWR